MTPQTHDKFLEAAIDEARKGLAEGGIPIGSVLVIDGQIVGRGHNRRVQKGSAILHAEMDAIENAGRLKASDYRRSVLYSTLSPCDMCSQYPEMKKFAQIVGKAEDEYLPSGPPMSPLTPSFFASWAFFDLQFEGTDTLVECQIEANDVFWLNADQLDALKKMSDSRMGIFEHIGIEGPFIRMRELITEDQFLCLSTSGYTGRKGQLWYVRRLPPLIPDVVDYHILFTTPYILVETTKDDWVQYLRRNLLKVKGANDREKLHRLLKYGLSRHHWNEFVFKAYQGHQPNVIFLAGIPDLKSTLPHG